MTARVLDMRRVGLCLAAGTGVIGYLTGAAAMLVPRRTTAAPLVFLALLPAAYATGVGFLALQVVVVAWLLALTLAAFKPDLGTAPRGPAGVLLAAPLQVAMWLLLVLAGFGFELLWVAQGSHPNNRLASPPAGSAKQADNAEGPDLLVAGLASTPATARRSGANRRRSRTSSRWAWAFRSARCGMNSATARRWNSTTTSAASAGSSATTAAGSSAIAFPTSSLLANWASRAMRAFLRRRCPVRAAC